MSQSEIRELKGANMDIDLIPSLKIHWAQENCPWNELEKSREHKCAVKNVSICKFFQGIKKPDIVLCAFPEKRDSK